MEYKVGVISGDGIGPEIVTEAKKVLDRQVWTQLQLHRHPYGWLLH